MSNNLSEQHEKLREEIVQSRELLLKELEKLSKKFDLSLPKRTS